VCWLLAQALYLSPARLGEDLCGRDVGFFLELRPFGTWFLWTTAVFAKTFEVDALGKRQQDVGHLVSGSVAELPSPMVIGDGDHYPTHHATDLVGDVVGRNLFEKRSAAASGRAFREVSCFRPQQPSPASGHTPRSDPVLRRARLPKGHRRRGSWKPRPARPPNRLRPAAAPARVGPCSSSECTNSIC